MLESQEISEEDSIQGDCGIDKDAGWISHDTSSSLPSEMGEINSLIERMVQARISDVLKENNNLKEENQQKQDQIEELTNENNKLHRALSEQVLLVQEYKDKLENLQKLFNENSQEEVTVITDGLDLVFDVTHFNEYIRIDQIHFLFLQLQKLVDIKIEPDKYLLDNASAVVPIYIVLTSSTNIPETFKYKGSMRDFCNEWNSNVVAYIKDKERAKALTCDYENFKRENSKEPWTRTSPATWRRDIINSRSKLKLNRAINIKLQLERLLKTIPSPCKQAV